MKNLVEKNLFIAHGFMKDFDSYKVEALEKALKSAEMENFVAWLEDRFEGGEEINTVEEMNTQLYKYYEGDDNLGFAEIFENVEDAKSYLAETKNNAEGMMKEGIL